MMCEVDHAVVVGKAIINGIACDHVLFSRPGVTFQLWVPAVGDPLPVKYVVTDTGTARWLSIAVVFSDWNVVPDVPDSLFKFAPPAGVREISFLSLETTGASEG